MPNQAAAARVLQAVAAAWAAAGYDMQQLVRAAVGNALQLPVQARLPLLLASQQALPQVRMGTKVHVTCIRSIICTHRENMHEPEGLAGMATKGWLLLCVQVDGLQATWAVLMETLVAGNGNSDGDMHDWCIQAAAAVAQQVCTKQCLMRHVSTSGASDDLRLHVRLSCMMPQKRAEASGFRFLGRYLASLLCGLR